MRKTVFGVSDQVRHNQAVQQQNIARGLIFRLKKAEELHYPRSENKGADQLICIFFFAYAKGRFFHDAAHVERDEQRLGVPESACSRPVQG